MRTMASDLRRAACPSRIVRGGAGRRRRGAVMLEYILIAGLVAIALIGVLRYFVHTMKYSMQRITEEQGKEVGRAYYFVDLPLREGPANDSPRPGLVKK